jgi:N-acetyl-anhydromuramyl-L-alanine amidase AmpD
MGTSRTSASDESSLANATIEHAQRLSNGTTMAPLLRSSISAFLLCSACAAEPIVEGDSEVVSEPALAMNVAATTNAGACAKVKAVKVADAWRTCEWDGKSKKPRACEKWSPSISDRCVAESSHGSDMDVDLSYFGEVDCRSSSRSRKVSRIVIHNGDHAKNNNENWKCRPSAAHYTVDRDGKIYQHMGEERAAWHANTENDDTIGIEIAIKRKHKGTCNSLPNIEKVAAAEGISPEDVVADMCGPTLAQYKSLAKLVADIKSRHTIVEDGIFGHCEIDATTHGDPKAFNWRAIGVAPRKAKNKCGWYHIAAIKGAVMSANKDGAGSRVYISVGSGDGIEVGDHGWLEDGKENIQTWFTVDAVEKGFASAWVSLPRADAFGKAATVVATPGKTPKALGSKATGASVDAPAATKPAIGSCEKDYTYWKSGKIASWTTKTDGSIGTVTLENLGWKQRVCDDSSGMIYVGDSTDAYVVDADGKKIRFKMTKVDETTATAVVFEGTLDAKTLGSNRRVVVRVKK